MQSLSSSRDRRGSGKVISMAISSQLKNYSRGLGKLVPFMIVILLWELLARSGIYNAKLFPAPTSIVRAFREMIAAGDFVRDLLMSVGRAFVGFASGALLGVSVGVLTGRSRTWRFLLHPILQSLRSVP